MGLLFTPFQYVNVLEFTYGNLIVLLIMSIPIILFGWMEFIKTNNPITRYNPFSLNPNWKSKMEYRCMKNQDNYLN